PPDRRSRASGGVRECELPVGGELAKRLGFELAGAIARDAKLVGDFVQGARLRAVRAVPEFEHAARPVAESGERLADALLLLGFADFEGGVVSLVAGDHISVRDAVVFSNRIGERHDGARSAAPPPDDSLLGPGRPGGGGQGGRGKEKAWGRAVASALAGRGQPSWPAPKGGRGAESGAISWIAPW